MKDIVIDINNGDFKIPEKGGKVSVAYQTDGELVEKVYLKIMIDTPDIHNDIDVVIPYIPESSECIVNIGYMDNSGNETPIRNPKNNSYNFTLTQDGVPIQACRLPLINVDGMFTLSYDSGSGSMEVYDMVGFDFVIDESLYQNATLLINLIKGGYLKHPSSGVGIQNYFNSPDKTQELGRVLIDELRDDGIEVHSADIDNETNTIVSLDISEK